MSLTQSNRPQGDAREGAGALCTTDLKHGVCSRSSWFPARDHRVPQHAVLVANVKAADARQYMIVLTDIEVDTDDTQSMFRLVLHSDVVDPEGLIATTSTQKGKSVAPESIRRVIRACANVHGQSSQARARRSSNKGGANTAWAGWPPARIRKVPTGLSLDTTVTNAETLLACNEGEVITKLQKEML